MPVIGQIWDDSLQKYIDVFDSPDSVPDDYVGTHVAVPQETIRPEEGYIGGAGTIRFINTPTGRLATGHATTDQMPGVIPLAVAIVIAVIVALLVVGLAILAFTATYYAEHKIDYVKPDGTACTTYVVQAGLAAPHSIDSCDNTWTSWGGGLGDLMQTLALGAIIIVGGIVFLKYIAPELPGLIKSYKSKKGG